MQLPSDETQEKLRGFLLRRTTYSVIDCGLDYAAAGFVSECAKSGKRISGVIRDHHGEVHSSAITLLSSSQIEAECSCIDQNEMEEQWCPHVVALLWRAQQLEFLHRDSGFAAPESTHRLNTTSAAELSTLLTEAGRSLNAAAEQLPSPQVTIAISLLSDRLGIKVLFDGKAQGPNLWGGRGRRSLRVLDDVLIQTLDEAGVWDEDGEQWVLSDSTGIDLCLGILSEYQDITLAEQGRQKISIATEMLKARFSLEWLPAAAELILYWILPDGSVRMKEGELIGTGPYWTMIEDTLYRLMPAAASIAALFPSGSTCVLSKQRVAPLLDRLQRGELPAELVQVLNPEQQPVGKIKRPKAVLGLERISSPQAHFTSGSTLEIEARLECKYPTAPAHKNVVYLPDAAAEKEIEGRLRELGFDPNAAGLWRAAGDTALDFVHHAEELLPTAWELNGLQQLRRGLRFADLKLLVAISAIKERPGRWDCQIGLSSDRSHIPLSTLFQVERPGSDHWVRLDNGAYAQVPGGGLAQLKALLGMLTADYRLANTIRVEVNTAQALFWSRIEDPRLRLDSDAQLKNLSRQWRDFTGIASISAGRSFRGKLRPYQQEGLSWLNFLNEFGLDGILADEMGLGKTVQTLALLTYLKESRSTRKRLKEPALVIAPTSVVTNWCHEAQRFAPKLKVLLLHGPARRSYFKDLATYDLVISSYALLRVDRFDLEKIPFSYVILDEAQNIKNPESATAKAAKALNSRHRLALTGTPTENRPLELWSLMDFLMPGYLGSATVFRTHLERPILEAGPQAASADLLARKVRPFILRRLKAEVEKDLPLKTEAVQYVEMLPSQAQLYNEYLQDVRPKVFEAVAERGVRGAGISILAALLRLRQICNHPNSIAAFRDLPDLESGKFNFLQDLLRDALQANRKILLFSQFRDMLGLIRAWLEAEQVNYLYLDGAVKERQPLIDEFNQNEAVRLFLISLKAGGTGLNLAAADTVILYDPWWNPAVEAQAIDRAHRIGQTKPVTVYRLITENSVEQKIMELKRSKNRLIDALINEKGLSSLQLSKKDLEELFAPLAVTPREDFD